MDNIEIEKNLDQDNHNHYHLYKDNEIIGNVFSCLGDEYKHFVYATWVINGDYAFDEVINFIQKNEIKIYEKYYNESIYNYFVSVFLNGKHMDHKGNLGHENL